jgi:preprotein translocase subunit YajC
MIDFLKTDVGEFGLPITAFLISAVMFVVFLLLFYGIRWFFRWRKKRKANKQWPFN